MHFLKSFYINLGIVRDLFRALWKRRIWWAIPIIFLMLIVLSVLLLAGHTGIAAFIYPLF